jgi:16S rRNA (cytosine967-C5)-methyltransferase
MTPSARLSAAIEVLADIAARRRPAPDALKDWGLARRFAGSKDRAAVASLVYDTLRRRASAAWIMGSDEPRAVLLGMLRLQLGLESTAIAGLCSGEGHAPAPLSSDELSRLETGHLNDAPQHVRCDVQDWLMPGLIATFGDDVEAEMAAMTRRAPIDIRINRLKTSRDDVAAALAPLAPTLTPYTPDGLRFAVGEDGRGPALQAEAGFAQGWYEIQDEGSQLAALAANTKPGECVVDLCAGAGGKTLALAALMNGKGELHATDVDARRLASIHARLLRAGVENVTVHVPRGKSDDPLTPLNGKADLVLVDAPCSGSGTWRRNPDAKWRLRSGGLTDRLSDQTQVLDRAARLIKPNGRIVYVTCSVLAQENDGAVEAFLTRNDNRFEPVMLDLSGAPSHKMWTGRQLSPLVTGCDGFFVTTLMRRS